MPPHQSGICVVMSTHNTRHLVRETLDSIDRVLGSGRRPYALAVVDDGSSDGTLSEVRRHTSMASDRITLGASKAPSVPEAKNRALRAARPLLQRYPWVLFMDDDDLMLPGRADLVDRMEAEGQRIGVGDWIYSAPQCAQQVMRGDWSLSAGMYSPGMTCVHRDALPRDFAYFPPIPPDSMDDMVAHFARGLTGIPWCWHGGNPVHHYRRRPDSLTKSPEHSEQMIHRTRTFLARRYPATRTSIQSFCSVAFGPGSAREAVLMVETLRASGNDQPVTLLVDSAAEDVIAQSSLFGVRRILVDSGAYDRPFSDSEIVMSHANLRLGAFLAKMDAVTHALDGAGSTMYLDADTVVLRRYMDVIDAAVGLVPELPRFNTREGSTWNRWERFGHFTGGQIYFDRSARRLVDWWRRQFLASWRNWFPPSMEHPHGCFVDQSCLDLLLLGGEEIHTFHPGHNFQYTRIPPTGAVEDVPVNGWGLYTRGWPVVSLHAHFRTRHWHTRAGLWMLEALASCQDEHHRDIAALVTEGLPSAP